MTYLTADEKERVIDWVQSSRSAPGTMSPKQTFESCLHSMRAAGFYLPLNIVNAVRVQLRQEPVQ